MTTEELLKAHPKTTTLIKKWMADRMTENTESLSEEFKEYVKTISLDDAYLIPIINTNPRNLFDVFDENDLHICTSYITGYYYTTLGDFIGEASERKKSEYLTIEYAFELLEKKL